METKPNVSKQGIEVAGGPAYPLPAEKEEFHSGEKIYGLNIVDAVAEFARRFVFLREDALYDLVASWIIATYLKEQFEYFGYLFVYSPEPQSGKSRLLEVLNLLVNDSSGVLVSPTEAVLFRTAASGTQLLDEVDSWQNGESLRGILNAGFQTGGGVYRIKETESGLKPEKFLVYGPRALAGIGDRILNVTTRDRSFVIRMERQTKSEQKERLRTRTISPEAKYLKECVRQWVDANREKIAAVYGKSAFPYLEEFRDRTVDIAEPIATIIEVAYASSEDIAGKRSRLLEAIAVTRSEDLLANDQHRVLRQLWQITEPDEPIVGSATELSELCGNLADPPSQDSISTTLRTYGFKTKNRRKDGGQPRHRYLVTKSMLTDLLARYGVEEVPIAKPAADEPPVDHAPLAKYEGPSV